MNEPLKISLPENPNFSLIPKVVRNCLENKANPEDITTEKNILDLNVNNFVF